MKFALTTVFAFITVAMAVAIPEADNTLVSRPRNPSFTLATRPELTQFL